MSVISLPEAYRLSDEEFRELMRRQYEDVLDIANGGFM
jgi:hypothetical protein